jgi:dGTPase
LDIWSIERRGKSSPGREGDQRIPHQHDYDRLLFSPPVRRLANKTQVFPLEKNDTVRTRLTHSHEVSNLARSMGDRILASITAWEAREREVRAILSAIGLAHDLGNPPFGHEGEKAIGAWFIRNESKFDGGKGNVVPDHLRPEFTAFEGNAQTIRVISKLQVSAGGFGLDLTAATMSALMKYPITCDERNQNSQATKKFGYFECESDLVSWLRDKTGLQAGQRHPLTWVMEAADDIAYSSLDIEDAIKKRILSPEDVLAEIEERDGEEFRETASNLNRIYRSFDRTSRSVEEIREIKASYFRTVAINHMICHAVNAFVSGLTDIEAGTRTKELLDGCGLCGLLKEIAYRYAFDSRGVRRVEADGSVAINDVMDFLWAAIDRREDPKKLASKRATASAAFGWTLFSDNYKQNAIRNHYKDRDGNDLPMRYKELRLLTDMMSGMTDGYLMDLHQSLRDAGHLRA